MKTRLSFLTLGLVGIVSMTPSCGPDEGTTGGGGDDDETECVEDRQCREGRLCSDTEDPNADGDGFCEADELCRCVAVGEGGGGTSGAGGKGGAGGSVITGGTSGTGGGTVTALGEPCADDAECGEGLVCLLPGGLPSGDGMPNGMCTLTCTANDECLEFADAAYCVGLEETAPNEVLRYCMLACDPGPTPGVQKCRLRDDFACSILDTMPAMPETPCVDINDCGFGQICYAEVEGNPEICHDMITACLPTCRADSDCDGGFCNFASGFCMAEDPGGLAVGELCDPTLPAADDPCNGLCLATDDTNTEGTCAAFCSAGPNAFGCGWTGSGAPDAGCLYATVISRNTAGAVSLSQSDLMICGALCDCNDDCPAEAEFCMDENATNTTASIMAIFGRQGYCRPLIAERMETEADSFACP